MDQSWKRDVPPAGENGRERSRTGQGVSWPEQKAGSLSSPHALQAGAARARARWYTKSFVCIFQV